MSIQLQTPHLFPRWHLNKPPPGSSVELSREPMALKWASYMRHNLVVVIVLHVMLHKREHKDTYRAEVTFDFSPCIWNWVPWDAFSVAVVSLSLSGSWGFIINVKMAAVQCCQDTISNICCLECWLHAVFSGANQTKICEPQHVTLLCHIS